MSSPKTFSRLRVVDQGFDHHQGSVGRQRVVCSPNEVQLLLQVPVVEDHPHRDEIGLRQRIDEEVARGGRDAIAQAGGGDALRRDGLDDRQVERRALEMRVPSGDLDAEEPGCAAHVAQRPEWREVELLGERLEVDARDAGHRVQELLQPRRLGVELLEHPVAAVLGLVLWLPGAKRLGKILPEAEQAGVQHLEDAAHVAGAGPVQVEDTGSCVAVRRAGAVAVAIEEAHRHQSVEEVVGAAGVQAELGAELGRGEPARSQVREELQLDRRHEHLGGPEGERRLEDRRDIGLCHAQDACGQ